MSVDNDLTVLMKHMYAELLTAALCFQVYLKGGRGGRHNGEQLFAVFCTH